MLAKNNYDLLSKINDGAVAYSPITKLVYKNINGELHRQFPSIVQDSKGHRVELHDNWVTSDLRFYNGTLYTRVFLLNEDMRIPKHKIKTSCSGNFRGFKGFGEDADA